MRGAGNPVHPKLAAPGAVRQGYRTGTPDLNTASTVTPPPMNKAIGTWVGTRQTRAREMPRITARFEKTAEPRRGERRGSYGMKRLNLQSTCEGSRGLHTEKSG